MSTQTTPFERYRAVLEVESLDPSRAHGVVGDRVYLTGNLDQVRIMRHIGRIQDIAEFLA